jgi:DNA-binding CsgD family transcriptional regulator
VIWNRAAERLLGHSAAAVLGKPCHAILCGLDSYGNRFCDEHCALEQMVRRHEAVRHFEMNVRKASGQIVRVAVSIVVVPGARPSQYTILHLLQPLATSDERQVPPTPGRIATVLPVVDDDAVAGAHHQPLTAREVEVLRLLADAAGTEEIADALFISATTVRNHVQNILRKLDAHSKLEAVSFALRQRLI